WPKVPEAQKWQMVEVIVNETFVGDLQTRTEFAKGIESMRTGKTAPPTPPVFDRQFYEKKLVLLTSHLKSHKGDVATTGQLKAELLHKSLPRVTSDAAPLVSIVIPYFHQGDTISATLDSLTAQTYRAFEVLVVSDGDESFPQDVLTAFAAKNPDIRVRFEMKPHSGLAGTRNWAIERAAGSYVLPLDSDDLLASIFLEKTVPVLESNARLSFVYTETLFFGEKNEIWSHVDFDAALLLHRNLMTCTTLFRREMWATVGGYATNMTHGYEDWDFWIGAVERGFTGTNVHLPLFLYRRKPQSMLANRTTFDRSAKAHIIANHPALFHEMTDANRAQLDQAPIGRIPQSFIRGAAPAVPTAAVARAADTGRVSVRQRPRILFVCHDFPPYRYAGAQLYAMNLAKEINRQGLADVHVLHPVFRERYDRFAITEAAFEGLTVFRLSKDKTVGYDSSIHHHAVETLVDAFLAEHHYDAVHVHGLGQLSTAPITVAKRHGIPTVMTLHDYWMLCEFWHLMTPDQQLCSGPDSAEKCAQCYLKFRKPSREQAGLTLDYMQKRVVAFGDAFRQLDAAIAPSRYLASTFERFGLPGVQVNPLGMPACVPQPKAEHRGLVLGFVGQIIARKGIEVLLRSFSQLGHPDVSLEIWGSSNEAAYLQRIVRQVGAIPNAHYKGPYTPTDLPSILAGLDAVVVPSFMENYPLVVQEAFMNRTPVVASRAGGIPEVVHHGRNGLLFATGDAVDLERQLRSLIDRPEQLAAFASNIPPTRTIADDAAYYLKMYETVSCLTPSR
ncbi:MAG: glycosyltransferase, partial [Acidobacteria bacterium]|nr:glycosyltransferase [Acidobacteriota bacterium]